MLVLELKEFFTRCTNDVIATTAFGIGVDSLKHPKNEFFVKGQEATNFGPWRFLGFLAFPKLMVVSVFKFNYQQIIKFEVSRSCGQNGWQQKYFQNFNWKKTGEKSLGRAITMGIKRMDWIPLARNRDQWRAFPNTALNIQVPTDTELVNV